MPDSALECYQALTRQWPCNPQFITTAVYGANYIGGETFTAVVGFMRARKDLFPTLPDVEIHDFGTVAPLDLIGEYGAQGYPMAAGFYSDDNGVILPHWSSILHASCPVASDGASVWIWNVEGYEVRLNLTDFARAFEGALVIFKRSIHQEDAMKLVYGNGDDVRHGKNATYASDGVSWKRYLSRTSEVNELQRVFGCPAPILMDQFTLDRIPEVETVAIDKQGSVVVDWAGLLAKVDSLKSASTAAGLPDLGPLTIGVDQIKADIEKLLAALRAV